MALTTDWNPKFTVGNTIDIFDLNRVNLFSPFDKDTSSSYLLAFKEIQKDAQNDLDHGLFRYKFNLCNNLSSYSESLKIDGSLSGNLGVVGAEADVTFCKSQTMNSNDIRLLIQSNHSGKSIVNGS
eukprot:228155_1